jgi:hypothetical protein
VAGEEQAAPPRRAFSVLLPDRTNSAEDFYVAAPAFLEVLTEIVETIAPLSLLALAGRELGCPGDRIA